MQLKQLWKAALPEIKKQVSTANYNSYITRLEPQDLSPTDSGQELVLACRDVFHQTEIQRRVLPEISRVINSQALIPTTIKLVISNKPQPLISEDSSPLFSQAVVNREERLKDLFKAVGFREELSLNNFAVSKSNEMAYAASKAVAQQPGEAYNPLFLYGGVGVGKTHLMQGVGQIILKKDMSQRVIYCSGEEFTNEIIDAIRKKSTSQFRKKYRSVRLLLIDDIQFIAGKTTVQEEFFHTFNAITKEGGQVIMTSDKPPKEIDSLEDRLRSRFEGGLTIDIGQPDFELRSAILQIKAKQMNIEISNEIIQYIAERESDTRALLGSLVTLSTLAKGRGQLINLDLAKEMIIKEKIDHKQNRVVTPKEIIDAVSTYYNSPPTDVMGPNRKKNLTLPRHIAMFLIKEELQLGLVDIGNHFNGRDHTSVMHGIKKITSLLKTDDMIQSNLNEIKSMLKS